LVTGVQTCALPISTHCFSPPKIDLKNGRPQPARSVIRKLTDATPLQTVSRYFRTLGAGATLCLVPPQGGLYHRPMFFQHSESSTEGVYSYRKATIGSTRIALRAGT